MSITAFKPFQYYLYFIDVLFLDNARFNPFQNWCQKQRPKSKEIERCKYVEQNRVALGCIVEGSCVKINNIYQ